MATIISSNSRMSSISPITEITLSLSVNGIKEEDGLMVEEEY